MERVPSGLVLRGPTEDRDLRISHERISPKDDWGRLQGKGMVGKSGSMLKLNVSSEPKLYIPNGRDQSLAMQ